MLNSRFRAKALIALLALTTFYGHPGITGTVRRSTECALLLSSLSVPSKEGSSTSKFRRIANDFGIGRLAEIRSEIRSIRLQALELRTSLPTVSDQVPYLKTRVVRFIDKNSILRGELGAFSILPHNIDGYLNAIGKDTIELLYVPGAGVPHIPSWVNRVGHIAIRVGGMVYHQTGSSGFRVETLKNFLYQTKKDLKVFGTVLRVSPKESQLVAGYLKVMSQRQAPYSLLLNNCAQAACRALSLTQASRIPAAAGFDPLVLQMAARRNARMVMRNVYNADKDIPTRQLATATTMNRLAFYGLPTLAGGAVTAVAFEATDLLLQYLEELKRPVKLKETKSKGPPQASGSRHFETAREG